MAHHPTDPPAGGTLIPRRTLLGLVLASAVFAPLAVGAGAGAAYADRGGHGGDCEDYDIPDDIGSVPWW